MVNTHLSFPCPPLPWLSLAVSSKSWKKKIRIRSRGVGLTPHKRYPVLLQQPAPPFSCPKPLTWPEEKPKGQHLPMSSLSALPAIEGWWFINPMLSGQGTANPSACTWGNPRDLVVSLQSLRVQEEAYCLAHMCAFISTIKKPQTYQLTFSCLQLG